MNKENQPRPKFTVRSLHGSRRREIRHHNPGARRRPPSPRVRVLSSITVVPPYSTNITAASTSAIPENDPIWSKPPPIPPPAPWVTPPDLEEPPKPSTPPKARHLIPRTEVEYGDEFQIIPGEAYQPVPIYINRDLPWRMRPIDVPVRRRVRRYRSDISDPRLHNLRVEVTPLQTIPDPEISRNRPEQLFATPRRPTSPNTSSSDVLAELIHILDQTYGCPRPAQSTPPVGPRTTPPIPPTTVPSTLRESSISDSLAALVRVARLFGSISPPTTPPVQRRFKRPNRRQRE